MSFILTIKAGDSYAVRFPAIEQKSNAEIWGEGGGTGGIDGYWADYATWIAAGNEASEEEFLKERAPNVVATRAMDLTGWSIRAHLRDGATKLADLDVQAEAVLHGGLVMILEPDLTATLDAKTFQAQVEFSKDTNVISSEVIRITVQKDVTYD